MRLINLFSVALLCISTTALSAPLNINLPVGSCPAGSVMASGGACGVLPSINDPVGPIVVTAPRLDSNGNPISGQNNSFHVPTSSSPGYVPAGWSNTGSTLNPPSTEPYHLTWTFTGGTEQLTPQAACNSRVYGDPGISENASTYDAVIDTSPPSKRCQTIRKSDNAVTGYADTGPSYKCDPGYTASGSGTSTVCTATNPPLAPRPPDGHCNIIQTGASFSGDAADPDCSAPTQGATLSPGGLSVALPGGSTTVVPTSAGGQTTTINVTNNDGSTSTTTIINTNSGGNVTGVTQAQTQGTGTSATAPASPTNGAGPPLDISGLNKEATQGQIKTGIDNTNTKLDTLHHDLDPTGVDTTFTTEKNALDTTFDNLLGAVSNAPSDAAAAVGSVWDWGVTLPSCGCEPLTMQWKGTTATFDWCVYINKFSDGLGYVLYLMTAMGLLAILTRRI